VLNAIAMPSMTTAARIAILGIKAVACYMSQATASITAQNFLAPADDLGYKVEYRHPYFFSSKDPKRTALAVSIFNARKLSGVFTPGKVLAVSQARQNLRNGHCLFDYFLADQLVNG
jgi:hypothetical protein